MSEQEFLNEQRENLHSSLDWFSNRLKSDREVWVAQRFLKIIGERVEPEDLSPCEDDPPDVLFRNARFEVKERLDANRRRTDEYRAALRRAESASNLKELLEHFDPSFETPEMILEDLERFLPEASRKYPAGLKSNLDLLVYYNRHIFPKDFDSVPDSAHLADLGFRSVSLCTGSRSWVLFASARAPSFLRSAVGDISGPS